MPLLSSIRSVGAWSGTSDPLKAASVPVLDGWGWADYWTIEDWMTWHNAMKAAFGLEEANRRFISEWVKQGIGANPLDARSFNEQFKSYAKANGFYDALYYGLGVLARPVGAGVDVVTTASNAVSSVAKAGNWILPVAIIGLGLAWYLTILPKGALNRR